MATAHSDDLLWWHDGEQWLTALSPDGRWWFDGSLWRPNRRKGARACRTIGLVLTALWPLVLFVLYANLASVPEYPGQPLDQWVLALHSVWLWWLVLGVVLVVAAEVMSAHPPVKPARNRH